MHSHFSKRHIGPNEQEKTAMLASIGVENIASLIDKTIPANIRFYSALNVSEAMSEAEYLAHITELGSKNKVLKSFIGLGYY